MHGRLTAPDGSPIAFGQAWLVPARGEEAIGLFTVLPPLASTTAGADGRFALRLEQAPAGRVELCVVAPRWSTYRKPLRLCAGTSDDLGDLVLDAGCSVEGVVTEDDELQTPIAHAEVVLWAYEWGLVPTPKRELGLVAHTDGVGRYCIAGAPAETVIVKAWARGHESKMTFITLESGSVTRCDVALAAADDVIGVVLDPDGRPVSGALVYAGWGGYVRCTRSERDGSFVLPAGANMSPIRVVAVGHASAEVSFDGTSPPRVTLQRLGAARVRAEGRAGRPIAEFVVHVQGFARDTWSTAMPPQVVHGDPDGSAVVWGLPPGRCRLRVEAPELAPAFTAPFDFVSGVPTMTVRLDEGGTIEGCVHGEDGAPLAGVTITTLPDHGEATPFGRLFADYLPCAEITRVSVVTDRNGQFRFVRLTPGAYYLKASHRGHCDARLDAIAVHANEVRAPDITIVRGAEVHGVVRGVDPVSFPYVVVDPAPGEPNPFKWADRVDTDDEGRFVLHDRLPPGRYRVIVVTGNRFWMRGAEQIIEITAADRVRHVELTGDATFR